MRSRTGEVVHGGVLLLGFDPWTMLLALAFQAVKVLVLVLVALWIFR